MNVTPKEASFSFSIETPMTHGFPSGEPRWLGELTIAMSGPMAGYTCVINYELDDGRIYQGALTLTPTERLPISDAVTNRALRYLRLGDVPAVLDAELQKVPAWAEEAAPWLEASRSGQRRVGRAGKPDGLQALVARRRVAADNASPRSAIAYMVATWPGYGPAEFVSESAAHAKVNRAKAAGMLEKVDGRWQLTQRADDVLKGTEA